MKFGCRKGRVIRRELECSRRDGFFQRAISGKVVTSFRKFNVRRRVTVLLWTMVVVLAKERCKISQRDARLRKIFRGWGTIALSICTYFISYVTCTRSLRSYLIFSFFSKFPPLFSLFPFLFFFSNNFHVQFLFPRLSIFVTKSIIQTRNQVVIRSCRQHSNWTVKKKKKKKKDTFFNVIHARIRAIESIGNNEPTVISG